MYLEPELVKQERIIWMDELKQTNKTKKKKVQYKLGNPIAWEAQQPQLLLGWIQNLRKAFPAKNNQALGEIISWQVDTVAVTNLFSTKIEILDIDCMPM